MSSLPATAVADAGEIWKEESARHTYSLRSVSSCLFNLSDSSTASNMSRSSEESSLVTCDSISTRLSILSHNQSLGQRVAQKNIPSSSQNREEEKEDTLASSRFRTRRRNKKFLGVRQRPSGRWVAEIKDTTQKIRLWLGTFDTAEAAARAYDEAACLLRGTNTRTNFIPHPSGKSSPIASKVAHMLQLRRNEVRSPGGTRISRQKDSFMQSDTYFNAGRISSNPCKSIVKSLSSNSANDEDSSMVALSPSIATSSLHYIEDVKSKDKTECFKKVATLCKDEALKNASPEVSFCRTESSRKSGAMPETELKFEKMAVKRAGAADKLAYKKQDCGVNCATFRNGSYLDAVLGLNDDMLGSNVSALTSAVDPFYSSFYFDDEPMATTLQLPDFPLTNEFSRNDGEPSLGELSDNNKSNQAYSETVIKCMRYERSNISTSLYAVNGVQDWLNQSDAILYDCLPSPPLSLSTSFQLPISSYAYSSPFNSSVDLSCKTDQTAALGAPLSETSSARTSYCNTDSLDPDQSQEAMWNSWDLPPLCPLSVA